MIPGRKQNKKSKQPIQLQYNYDNAIEPARTAEARKRRHKNHDKYSFNMNYRSKYLRLIAASVLATALAACGDTGEAESPADEFDVRIELPATADVTRSGELTLKVSDGKAPLTTDAFLLEGGGFCTYVLFSEHLMRILPSA